MHHVIYLSWAAVPFTDEQLQDLLAVARYHNEQLEITGILLYGNERFMQVLEGEEAAVRIVYTQIRCDTRHGNIITLADKPIAQRAFAEWSMAFQTTTPQQLEYLAGYLGPTNVAVNTAGLSCPDTHLFNLLRSFVLP